jgi:hypothetical protein
VLDLENFNIWCNFLYPLEWHSSPIQPLLNSYSVYVQHVINYKPKYATCSNFKLSESTKQHKGQLPIFFAIRIVHLSQDYIHDLQIKLLYHIHSQHNFFSSMEVPNFLLRLQYRQINYVHRIRISCPWLNLLKTVKNTSKIIK